jgi:hypothetical protein
MTPRVERPQAALAIVALLAPGYSQTPAPAPLAVVPTHVVDKRESPRRVRVVEGDRQRRGHRQTRRGQAERARCGFSSPSAAALVGTVPPVAAVVIRAIADA